MRMRWISRAYSEAEPNGVGADASPGWQRVRATASARSPDALSPRPNQSLSAQVRTRRRVNW